MSFWSTVKEIVTLIGAIVGVASTSVSLYARYVDMKKRAAEEKRLAERPRLVWPPPASPEALAAEDPRQLERARSLVKGPAVSVIVMGFLGVGLNLLWTIITLIDQFVHPLLAEPAFPNEGQAMLGIIMYLSLALGAGTGIWAGFSMLKLRSYWLSVAGSLAIMPGGILCFFAGIPVGIWSLIVLRKTEVSSSFS
jgi:hypothetical protein